jgi:hypothetical protein
MPGTSIYFADLGGDGRVEGIAKEGNTLVAWHQNGINADGTVAWDIKGKLYDEWYQADTTVKFA